MKSSSLALFVVATFSMLQSARAEPVSFDFSSITGSTIRFIGTGNKIEFPATTDFVIIDASAASLVNLNGSIGGTYVVGAISNPSPGVEQAPVTTTNGTFSVFDGAVALTADLDWKDILVYNGLSGVLNGMGIVNLTNIAYTGTNAALAALRDGSQQTAIVTFQFSPLNKKTLTQLMTDGQVNTTSFSGSVSAVPEPSTVLMLAAASILAFSATWLRRRILSA